ncbi:hypothetical protein AUP43_15235 [Oceanibaculum pacificum]|uniref:Ribbon-helix-helix domain-containing protein n=1 Tax=Oceanibaculum pacificum TaxID=580166 RepID=A0A154V6L6_9PROT|nr:ribbon-helix-helix domain-containing protein [Oceanibaculum pacificum]KZC97013.1 hypothetical protein AUP43_15235 [Oceanibaculum pacificum]
MTERAKRAIARIADVTQAHRSSRRIRRNVKVSGRRTSVSLEVAVWDALAEICTREDMTIDLLCDAIEARRRSASLASALRIFALVYFRVLEQRLYPRPKAAAGGLREGRVQAGFPAVLESALDSFDQGRRRGSARGNTPANSTQANSTQANSTQANSTQANSTQANSTQANSTQANSTQANSTQANSQGDTGGDSGGRDGAGEPVC